MRRMRLFNQCGAATALALALWLVTPATTLAQAHDDGHSTVAEDVEHRTAQAVEHAAGAIDDGHAPAGAAADEHGAADAHGGGGHEEPKVVKGPSTGAIPAITTLVIFVVLLIVLTKFAWGPIVAGLRQREEKIRKDIADAEAARARAEGTLKDYSAKLAAAEAQIRDMLAKAQSDAERTAAGIRARGQQEAEEIKERATRDIDAARAAAVTEIQEYAVTLATSAAEKILRRELRPEDQRDLVNRSLEQLQTTKI